MREEKGKREEETSDVNTKIIDRLWEIELILLAILVISIGMLISSVVGG